MLNHDCTSGTDLCLCCAARTTFYVTDTIETTVIRGTRFSFHELHAICAHCGSEMYVSELDDMNADARMRAYQAALKQ